MFSHFLTFSHIFYFKCHPHTINKLHISNNTYVSPFILIFILLYMYSIAVSFTYNVVIPLDTGSVKTPLVDYVKIKHIHTLYSSLLLNHYFMFQCNCVNSMTYIIGTTSWVDLYIDITFILFVFQIII
jgi:hypothetical protein